MHVTKYKCLLTSIMGTKILKTFITASCFTYSLQKGSKYRPIAGLHSPSTSYNCSTNHDSPYNDKRPYLSSVPFYPPGHYSRLLSSPASLIRMCFSSNIMSCITFSYPHLSSDSSNNALSSSVSSFLQRLLFALI